MGMRLCPKCFNDSLNMCSRGAIDILLNGKKMNTGRFLFNVEKDSAEKFEDTLIQKLDEYFQWYGKLSNKGPIEKVEICSANFICDNKCKVDLNYRFSVVDILISTEKVHTILAGLAKKHEIPLKLK